LSGGRFDLEAAADGARCRPTTAVADVCLGMGALGAISLGGVPAFLLAEAGLIEGDHFALDRLFRWPVTPWCSTFF
jgi:hypothetical protein